MLKLLRLANTLRLILASRKRERVSLRPPPADSLDTQTPQRYGSGFFRGQNIRSEANVLVVLAVFYVKVAIGA